MFGVCPAFGFERGVFQKIMETIAEKNFTLNLREFVYALTLAVALLGQWYSNKAALNEAVLNLKAEQSLLRLEVTVLKAQIEELKRAK